jgi:hypothetical protein
MALTTNQQLMAKLYLASFNRAPEKSGLDYWTGQLSSGTPFSKVISTIFSLDIVKAIYPDSLPDNAFLTQIYINIFNKVPDTAGINYWIGKLALGAQRSALVLDMINAGVGTPDGTPGKEFILNRLAASEYAINVQAAQNVSINTNTLKIIMSFVNEDPNSINIANSAINGINTGGLDAPTNPLAVPVAAATGLLNLAQKTAGVAVTVDLKGTNAAIGNTVLILVNDDLFPVSVTKILVAADITAQKVIVTIPSTAGWGADGLKNLSVRLADVPTGHIGPVGGTLALTLDATAPTAFTLPLSLAGAVPAVTTISGLQKTAGVSVLIDLTGTNALAGDTVQLLLNGAPFSPVATKVLTANDILAKSATLTVPGTTSWGVDGSKALSVKITDVAGNVGPIGGNLTVTLDTALPILSSSTPADNAINIAIGSSIVLNFNEAIIAGVGNIVISDGGSDVRTIAIGDTTQVTIVGNSVTIKPMVTLLNGVAYNIQMAAGVLHDVAGNNYAGIASPTILNFTIAPVPAVTVSAAISLLASNPAALYSVNDTAAALAADAATNGGSGTAVTGHNVSFTDTPTITQITAVDLATTGTLAFTGVSGTAALLAANTTSYVIAGKNIVVTDAATISQLTIIDNANGTGTLTYAAGVSDAAAALVTNNGGYIKAATNVTVIDSPTVAQLTTIDAVNTTGSLTYTASVIDTAANLAADALQNSGAGKYVTGHNVVFINAASITQLAAVDAATTGSLTYASGVSDTASNLALDAATNGGVGTYTNSHDIIVTNAASVTQLTVIRATTTGTVVYASGVGDTAANLVADAQTNGGAGTYVANHNVSFTNAVTLAQLAIVDAATTGTLTYSSITDTVAALIANTAGYVNAGKNVIITDTATIGQLTGIDAANTTGSVAYTSITGTASQLYHGGIADAYIVSGTNVTVTDAIAVSQLVAIDIANGSGTLTYAVGITDSYAGYSATTQIIGLINAATANTVIFTNSGAETSLNVSGITRGVLINGGSGAETIVGGSGADTIIGGAGADTLTGGGGADQFKYTTAGSGADTITDFTLGTDIIRYTAALANGSSSNATAVATQFQSSAAAITANITIYNHTVALADTTAATVAAASIANGALGFITGTETAGDKLLIVVHSATTTAIYEFASAAQDDVISVGELTLLATLTGVVTGLTTANGADFLTI